MKWLRCGDIVKVIEFILAKQIANVQLESKSFR